MILGRYIQRSILLGTLGALLLLVSLSFFFEIVSEFKDLDDKGYGLLQAFQYALMNLPGEIVEFLPLAALLGSMLSLGALAANSEIIAMQASGMSLGRLLASILQAAALLAVIGFLLGDWVVPDSESAAQRFKARALDQTAALSSDQSLWLKDGARVVHIARLLPNGYASEIEIFELDAEDNIASTLRAARAVPVENGWELQQVTRTAVYPQRQKTQSFDSLLYEGRLSQEILQVLNVKPSKMSTGDLLSYLEFLDENQLESRAERLILWKKLFAPLTILIMCLMALPFILGSQRQSSSGQRLMIGIMLGLVFVVVDRLLTQLGGALALDSLLIALLPNLVFLALAVYLLSKNLSHGVGVGFGAGFRAR